MITYRHRQNRSSTKIPHHDTSLSEHTEKQNYERMGVYLQQHHQILNVYSAMANQSIMQNANDVCGWPRR